jgi:cytochrome c2
MEESSMKRVQLVTGLLAFGMVMSLAAATGGDTVGAVAGDPVKGKQVYDSSNPKCSLCHKIGATGGKLGPELTSVGTKRDAAWLTKYLADPKATDPKNKMPAVKVKGQDLENLVAYLLTLKGK